MPTLSNNNLGLSSPKRQSQFLRFSLDPNELWKDLRHLGGLINGEGSIFPWWDYDEKYRRWYVGTVFSIEIERTLEWEKVARYWHGIYGGHIRLDERFLRWTISKREELEKFLNDIIPYLTIKKQDAIKMRRFLLRYKQIPYTQKGQTTKEKAIQLWQKLSAEHT